MADKLKVNFIIPFYKNLDTIENCLRSLDDQDYKNFNAIIVFDGQNKTAEKKVIKWIEEEKFKFPLFQETIKKNKGAAYARNYGARMINKNLISEQGDILFFLDADSRLCPGMLRECVTQFELNSDIDFVYGNYRFDDLTEFYSQPFDPYLLQTMNYVPTMSPVKRIAFEFVNGFEEDQKYFQDWSLFYRLSDAGCKGKYLNEMIFTTAVSDKTNISGKFGSLDKKAMDFRHKHNIKDRSLVVTTHAAPLQAIQRAKMLDADYVGLADGSNRAVFPINYNFSCWLGTYFVGLFNDPIEALENHMNVVVGKPIYHLIGTDVYQFYNAHSVARIQEIKKELKKQNAKVFVNSKFLKKEMDLIGIDTELLYTPIYDIERFQNLKPLPKKFTVAVYISDTNPMHHMEGAERSNMRLVMDVAASMPNIQFKLFGGNGIPFAGEDGQPELKKDNVEIVGKIDNDNMVDFINECSMVLRPTIHDGFPQLPIQFLLCGRQALVSYPEDDLLYAEKLSFMRVENYEAAKSELIDKILNMKLIFFPNSQSESFNRSCDAHEYYSDLMCPKKFKERVYQCLEK